MDYVEFETRMIELLTRDGWIDSVTREREDTRIEWTARGRERAEDFFESVFALEPRPTWSERDLAQLRAFGQYFGFVETTPRERLERRLAPTLRSRNVLAVTVAPSGRRSYRLFTARNFDDFYPHVEQKLADGRQVVVISVEDILDSDVGRAFASGETLWQRGPGDP